MAIVIYYKPEWMWFDPLCTVLFSVIVFFTTVPISKECTRILMEASPENKDYDLISQDITEVPGVLSLLEIRMWNITESKTVLSAKVLLERYSSSTVSNVKKVCQKHRIYHNNIEVLVRSG